MGQELLEANYASVAMRKKTLHYWNHVRNAAGCEARVSSTEPAAVTIRLSPDTALRMFSRDCIIAAEGTVNLWYKCLGKIFTWRTCNKLWAH